jgi:ariadne-1
MALLIPCLVDFDDDQEPGFAYDKEAMKPTRRPYEVDFRVLSPADIQSSQLKQIDEVCQILGLPPESVAILLRYMRWNKEKLIETYMDKSDELLDEAGLGPQFAKAPRTEMVRGFTCEICYEDGQDLQTYAMVCGHRYCVDCYSHYLIQKVKEEGEAARIQCPRDGCHRIVDSKSLKLLVDDGVKDRCVPPFLSCQEQRS